MEIQIAARVNVIGNIAQNRIVFKRNNLQAEVTCTHTAISTISAARAIELIRGNTEGIVDLARSPSTKAISLPPEEHFAALKSYVEGIAEVGICTMMISAYYSSKLNPSTLPYGFNSAMQSQILRCLNTVAEQAIRPMVEKVLIEIASSGNSQWFYSRLHLLNNMYFQKGKGNIYNFLFGDIKTFKKFDNLIRSEELLSKAASSKETDPKVLYYLAQVGEKNTQWAVLKSLDRISNNRLKADIFRTIMKDSDEDIFTSCVYHLSQLSKYYHFKAYEASYERFHSRIAQIDQTIPRRILLILVEKGDLWIKKLISLNPATPYQAYKELAHDSDKGVRSSTLQKTLGSRIERYIQEYESNNIKKTTLFNGNNLSIEDAKGLSELENSLDAIICSKLQVESNPILELIPKNKIAPIITLSDELPCKIKELDLQMFSSIILSPEALSWLDSLRMNGCKIIFPSIEGVRLRKKYGKASKRPKDKKISLYKHIKNGSLTNILNLDNQRIESSKLKKILEVFELNPFGKFLEYTEEKYESKKINYKKTGYVLDKSKTTGLILKSQNNLYQKLSTSLTSKFQGFIIGKLNEINKITKKKAKIKIGGSWYDSKMISKVCNSLGVSNPEEAKIIFVISNQTFPLLMKNPDIPIIGSVAPLVKPLS